MIEEREDDAPDWEIREEEKIPDSLEKKWRQEEKEGLRAGVCRSCGWPFTKEDLSCRHCGVPTEMPEGAFLSFKHWLFKTPLGIMTFIIIFIGVLVYLIH